MERKPDAARFLEDYRALAVASEPQEKDRQAHEKRSPTEDKELVEEGDDGDAIEILKRDEPKNENGTVSENGATGVEGGRGETRSEDKNDESLRATNRSEESGGDKEDEEEEERENENEAEEREPMPQLSEVERATFMLALVFGCDRFSAAAGWAILERTMLFYDEDSGDATMELLRRHGKLVDGGGGGSSGFFNGLLESSLVEREILQRRARGAGGSGLIGPRALRPATRMVLWDARGTGFAAWAPCCAYFNERQRRRLNFGFIGRRRRHR